MKKMLFKITIVFILCANINIYTSYAQVRQYQCIDENANILFKFDTHYVWPFSDGMALFKTRLKDEQTGRTVWRVGFINDKGEIVIDPIFDSKFASYYKFSYGVSWVKRPNETGFVLINKKGEIISEKSYEKVGYFKDSLCAVYENEKLGFINIFGHEVIPCKYFGDDSFNEGLVSVCLAEEDEHLFGFLDVYGNVAIPFEFSQEHSSGFQNGEARVVIKGKTQLIDRQGNIVFIPELANNMQHFFDGLALSFEHDDEKKFGFFDRDNNWIITPIYEYATSFNMGRSIVCIDGKYGLINPKCEQVITIRYDNLQGDCDTHGYFVAIENSTTYFFNCNGEFFTDIPIKHIYPRNNGIYNPFKAINDKFGYLDYEGNIHIEAVYEYAESFSEGKAWVY